MPERHTRWLKAGKWLAGLALLAVLAAVIETGIMFHRDAKQALPPGAYLGLFCSLILGGGVLIAIDVSLARTIRVYPGFNILKMGKRAGTRLNFMPGLLDAFRRGEIKSLQQGKMGYQVPTVCCVCLGKADAKDPYETEGAYSYREGASKYDVRRTFRFHICQACTVIHGAIGRWLLAIGASLVVIGGLAIYLYLHGDLPGIGSQFAVLVATLVLPALPSGVAVNRAPQPVDVLAKAAQLQVANPRYAALLAELNPKWTVVGAPDKRGAASTR